MDIFREVKSELSKLLDTERYPKLSEEEKLAAMVEKVRKFIIKEKINIKFYSVCF